MTSHDAFSAEEVGTGSRATLTPIDRAFLESAPSYDEDELLVRSLVPAPLPAPSTGRRVLSLLLFVAIAGAASGVLALAVLRYLGHAALP